MELSSNNLFGFALRRYKQKKNKNNREEQIFKFQKISANNSPKKEPKKINNTEIINYFHALIINNSNISSILYNSVDPLINECFNNLEFLSITNNYIRNIDFILKLPNLFFLDLFGNPLEELTALNTKNIFGYLRLSIESFNEKKILNIHDLQCGIFDVDLKDKNNLKLFSNNNHHICMMNNEINLIIDKIKYEENKKKFFSKKRIRKSDLSLASYYSNSNADLNYSETKIDTSMNKLIKNLSNNISQDKSNEFIPENPVENIIIPKNPFLLKIKKFFDDYQAILNKLAQNDYKNQNDYKIKRNLYLKINETLSSQNLSNDKAYLAHEKDKLILLYDIYKKISIFNKDKNDNKYYIGNIYNINVNNHLDKIFIKEIKDNIMSRSQIPRSSIIILISILFYTIGIISEKMMSALINYILTKYYNYDENHKFPDFSNMGDIHYLAFYYSTYDYIYKRMIDNEKNISISQYKEILNILRMEKLVIKSNYIYKKLKDNKSNDTIKKFCEHKKKKITDEINSIKELNITKDFLVLIEFLCDYIIYEKIEDILINNSYLGEYSYLIELKETIEETEFQIKNNNVVNSSSLSVLKFQKNKKERLYNKFYFEKDKIKQIKNKEFKKYVLNDFNKSRTLNNFSTAYGNNSLFNTTNLNFNNINNNNDINNEEKGYNKIDDIDVDEFFYIDNIIKNNNNKVIRRKNNFNNSIYKSRDKDTNYFLNENSFDDENNSSIKLPNLYYNQQPYEEFEFLKKMIFDPDFLSQHARNVIKFEKQKKRLQRRFLNLNKSKKINRIDISENKYEESKPNENAESTYLINLENNNSIINKNNANKSKNNLNIESNENYSNFNNKKAVLNSTNSSSYMKNKFTNPNNYKLYNKINLKTIIDNDKEKNSKKTFELSNKGTLDLDKKCSRIKHDYKSPFFETPQSFPGITLLKFGIKKNKTDLRKIKILNRKSPFNKEIQEDNKKSYKQKVMTKIKQTIRDNILRNARRFAYPVYQKHS